MKNYYLVAVIALIVFLMSPETKAQQTDTLHYQQVIQDVFKAELVYPQEKSEFQFTLMPHFHQSNDINLINVPLNVEFGLTDSWQVGLGLNTFQSTVSSGSSVKGLTDLELDSKYSFMNIGNTNFHAALGFEIGIPLKSENNYFGNGTIYYEPYTSLAVDLPGLHQAQLFAMIGLEFFGQRNKTNEESEPAELNLNGGFFVPFKQIVLTSELSCNTSKLTGGNEIQLYYTPGVILNLPGAWKAGLGIPIGINQQSDDYGMIAMITFEFNSSDRK